MEDIHEYKNTLIGIAVLVIAVVGLMAFIQKDSSIITLVLDRPDSRIYVDRSAHKETDQERSVDIELAEGTHNIIVDVDGFWPWKKDITVTDTSPHTYRVFNMAKQPQGSVIDAGSSRSQRLLSQFATSTLPTRADPLTHESDSVSVWIENDTRVRARWNNPEGHPSAFCENGTCNDTITAFTASSPIRNINFYNNYPDVVIYAAGEHVAVRELDSGGTQNVQPIYTGTAPSFILGTSTNSVFVREEDGTLMQLAI